MILRLWQHGAQLFRAAGRPDATVPIGESTMLPLQIQLTIGGASVISLPWEERIPLPGEIAARPVNQRKAAVEALCGI
jgi:hypothetical protein